MDGKHLRQYCGSFMQAKTLKEVAFGTLKAQIQPTPIEKTIYTYFTLGNGAKNAKQIQWELSIGLGDHPIAIDQPVYFYIVIAIILVLGCCLCVMREKYDESSGKRWGYPPNFQFAVIGYDTLGNATDRVITIFFDEAINQNKHVEASDFEVIIHKEKPCLEYNQHGGRFCKCKESAFKANSSKPDEDISFGKVKIKKAEVLFTSDGEKTKLHGAVQLHLADKWPYGAKKDVVDVIKESKMITVSYTRQVTAVEESKVMNFCSPRHLQNICLHGDVMNSIRLCCGWEEEEVELSHLLGANPCLADRAGNSVKSFMAKQVYNFVGMNTIEEYMNNEVIVYDKIKKKKRNISDYELLDQFDNWQKLISDDNDEDSMEKGEDIKRKSKDNSKKEVAMKDVEKEEDNDEDGSEDEDETSGLLKKEK